MLGLELGDMVHILERNVELVGQHGTSFCN